MVVSTVFVALARVVAMVFKAVAVMLWMVVWVVTDFFF